MSIVSDGLRAGGLALFIAWLAWTAPASASALSDAETLCFNGAPKEGLEALAAACTSVIESTSESAKNRAQAYYRRGIIKRVPNSASAIEDWGEAIKLQPDFVAAYNQRGDILKWAEPSRALKDFDNMIALKPELASGYLGRGFCYAALGKYDRAITDYSVALNLKNDLGIGYLWRGGAYAAVGDYEHAISDFDVYIADPKMDPRHGLQGRAAAHYALGQFDAAIQDFDKAIQFRASDPAPVTLYARGLAKQHNKDAAAGAADIAAATVLDLKIAYTFADYGVNDCEFAKPIGACLAALASLPQSASTLYFRGLVEYRVGQFGVGSGDEARASELDPMIGETFSGTAPAPHPALAEHWVKAGSSAAVVLCFDADSVKTDATGVTSYRGKTCGGSLTSVVISEQQVRCDQDFSGKDIKSRSRGISVDGRASPDHRWLDETVPLSAPGGQTAKIVCHKS